MVTTFPVQQAVYRGIFDADDDLSDHGAQDSLLELDVALGMVPHGVQILTESAQRPPLIVGDDLGVLGQGGDGRLQLADHPQPLVPAALELCGDQTILGIRKLILSPRTLCFVARLLKFELFVRSVRRHTRRHPLRRRRGSLYAQRRHDVQERFRDYSLQPQRADAGARAKSVVDLSQWS